MATAFEKVLTELRKDVPKEHIKQREGWRDRNGNAKMVDYVEWHTVADILDKAAPAWEHHVKSVEQVGDIMTVVVVLTICGVSREGLGTGLANVEMGIKKAEHDALKRAAVKFGVGRELYKKEADIEERVGSSGYPAPSKPDNPIAKSLSDLVTAKQLGMIRALCRELDADPDELSREIVGANTEELSKKAASFLITGLQEYQSGAPDSGAVSQSATGASSSQINAIRNLCNSTGADLRVVLSDNNASALSELSGTQAAKIIKDLQAM